MEVSLAPSARFMIVCDEVLHDEQRPGKVMIVGLTTLVVWPSETTTALRLEKLTVHLILTDGRGTGAGRIVCFHEETGVVAFESPPKQISFEGKDPAGHYGVTFKLLDCPFPARGVYVVRFLFNETVVH